MRGHWTTLGAGAFLALVVPVAARAETQQQIDWCSKNAATPDQQIEGCTAVIGSSGWSAAALAIAYSNRGSAYDAKHDYDRAIADYTAAIRLDPTDAAVYNRRGAAYDKKHDYSRAIADFSEAIRLDQGNWMPYSNRGFAYIRTNDFSRAIADYSEAIRLGPLDQELYYNRGSAYADNKDYIRAIADFSQAIRLDPEFRDAFEDRSFAYLQLGKFDEAIADNDVVVKLPDLVHTAPLAPEYVVYLDFAVMGLMQPAADVVKAAADSFRKVGASRIDLVGHTDTAEADSSVWHKEFLLTAKFCRKLPSKQRLREPSCEWKEPNAKKLGLIRAQIVANELVANGVPRSAIHLRSVGADDPAVPTPPATREPMNRTVNVDIR